MPNIPCRKLSCSSRKGISFIHCSCVRMEKFSTVPGLPACLIVRMKEQSILFPTPFASANNRIPQKSRTAFLKVSKSLCSVVDIGKRAFSLWIKDFLLLSDIKKTHQKSYIWTNLATFRDRFRHVDLRARGRAKAVSQALGRE